MAQRIIKLFCNLSLMGGQLVLRGTHGPRTSCPGGTRGPRTGCPGGQLVLGPRVRGDNLRGGASHPRTTHAFTCILSSQRLRVRSTLVLCEQTRTAATRLVLAVILNSSETTSGPVSNGRALKMCS